MELIKMSYKLCDTDQQEDDELNKIIDDIM